MGKTFYISDIHAGHNAILGFDNRPFKTVEEMDEEIAKRWNDAVGVDDYVWVLGDISWLSATKTVEFYKNLNGIKNLCIGNHDKSLLRNKDVRALFNEVVDYKEIDFGDGTGVVLCHYPIPCFNKHYYGWYHLYGHVHSSFEWNMMERVKYEMDALYSKPCNMYNVGCMMTYMDYTPRTLEEIIAANK